MTLRDYFLSNLTNGDADGWWFSHRALLWLALEATEGSVLELGCGYGSTPYLHRYCSEKNRQLLSLESEHGFVQQLRDENYPVEYVANWDASNIENDHWGVILVDHAPPEQRALDVAKIYNRCDIIVIHDSQPEATSYGLDTIWHLFKHRMDINVGKLETAAVSNTIDIEKLWSGRSFEGRIAHRAKRNTP